MSAAEENSGANQQNAAGSTVSRAPGWQGAELSGRSVDPRDGRLSTGVTPVFLDNYKTNPTCA
jgi:hypothetical protein